MKLGPEALMAQALELARRGHGAVEPNPRVGAVAVVKGTIAEVRVKGEATKE